MTLQKTHWIILGLILTCGLILGIAVIGLHLTPWSMYVDPSEGHSISTMQGGLDTLILDTEFPKSPVSMPIYKVISIDHVAEGIPEKAFTTKKSIPSAAEAPALAEKGLEKYGGLPKDAQLVRAIPSYQYKYNLTTNAVEEQKPVSTQVIYHQMLNGSRVIGGSINLDLGENGEIISIVKIWPAYEYAGEVNITPAELAYEKLMKGEAFKKPQGVISEGTKIIDIKLGYEVTGEKDSYLKPVWIFYAKSPPRPTSPPSPYDSTLFTLRVDATQNP
ncbi:MAG: two-component system regulatory protein YycI [Methanoregula sp.]|jgi:hypothetical protein|nr:two-component system regulatory protein YycI [Methanoregula sp.]